MKVRILPEHLTLALRELSRVVPKRVTLPIVRDVLAEADQGRLKLTATDLKQTLTCWVGAVWEEEGRCILPVAQLVKMLPKMGDDAITLSCHNGKVGVEAGARSLTLPSADPDDFPPTPEVEGEWGTVSDLADGLKRVAFCMARDDARPVLAGVYLEADGDTLKLTATDGWRVGHVLLPYDGPAFTGIIPMSAAVTLSRLAKDDVRVRADGKQIVFDLAGMYQLTAALIQGTFPNYGALVPKEDGQHRVSVDRDYFRSEVAAAMVIAKESSDIVRLRIEDGDSLSIQGEAEGVGDYKSTIPAKVVGDDGKMAIDGRYLDAFCTALDKGVITLDWQDNSSIVRLRQEGFDGFYLVMSMSVSWEG